MPHGGPWGYPVKAGTNRNAVNLGTATTLVAASGAGTFLHLKSLMISASAALNFVLQDNAGTPVVNLGAIYLPANGTIYLVYEPGEVAWAANTPINILASGTAVSSAYATAWVITT